jgi:hypothetical protein
MINNPSDNTTLSAVLAGYEDSGFDGSFSPMNDGRIECLSCGSTLAASQFTMASLRRLEGASDPDDMIAVVAITCPKCDTKGVLVLGYGPMASAEDTDILALLDDRRGEASLQPDASPADSTDPTLKSARMQSADVANGERP